MALINCKIVNSNGVEGSVSVVSEDTATDIPTQSLYIIPDEGYVVSALDFDHGTIDDTEIESISFSDQTTAGTIGNVVKISIDMEDNYSISDNTVININFLGSAIDANLINVIPHIVYEFGVGNGMVEEIAINKILGDIPPDITNVVEKNYTPDPLDSNSNYNLHITYLPCTIQPNTWTKIGTITVKSKSGAGGHFHMKDVPYLENLTPDGTGLPLYELVRTYDMTTAEEVDADSGATKRIDFDIMFKDSHSHELVPGAWPTNYDTVASRDDSVGVRLVVPRPAWMYDIVSENVIEVINLNDFGATLDDIEANEFIDTNVPDKSFEIGSNPLDPIPLNPGNTFMPNATGIINKVVEESPNPISIQGTPGAEFELEFVEVNAGGNINKSTGQPGDVTGGKWANYDEGTSSSTPIVFKIPASGTWVGALTDIPQRGEGDAGLEFELKVTAKNGSTISPAAARPQSEGTITAVDGNSAAYRFKQPCSDVFIKIKLVSTGDVAAYSEPRSTDSTTVGSEHILVDVHGFGTAPIDSIFEKDSVTGVKTKASYVSSFTATIDGMGGHSGNTAVLTGNITLEKLPNEDLTLEFDWDGFVNASKLPWEAETATPTDFTTAGLSASGSEVGTTTWTGAGTTGAEISITNVTLTIN